MSWESYIHGHMLTGSGLVEKAAIFGIDGATWAAGAAGHCSINVSQEEKMAIIEGAQTLMTKGIFFDGQKFQFLREYEEYMYGKAKGNGGICITKMKTMFIVGTYSEEQDPGLCYKQVGDLRDYLASLNM